ncbi:MAG: glycosyltransferase [Clostridiales bacterium]|jgi:GT2 family glycosyltransferase|nr:glycosyltransferase [Clostridiales bacterium]
MNEINSEKYWDERFLSGDWADKDGRAQSRFFYNIMFDNFPKWLIDDINENSLSICDLGSAEGEGVYIFDNKFKNSKVSGCDFSNEAIKNAKKNFKQCDFFCADMNNLERQYDVFLLSNVLEHFEHPQEIVKKLIPFCKKYLIILVPFREFERIDEHFYTFVYDSFFLKIENFLLVYHKEINCKDFSNSYWNGYQLFIIYENIEFKDFESLTLEKSNNKNFDRIICLDNDIFKKNEVISNLRKNITKILSEKDNLVFCLKDEVEEHKNAIMQIQFEAMQFKQASLDAKETYIWKTGAKIEKFFKRTGIYLIRSMLETLEFKRVGFFLSLRKILNEIFERKKIKTKEKMLISNSKFEFINNTLKSNIVFKDINFFHGQKLVSIVLKIDFRTDVGETIESILKQTYENFELILLFENLFEENLKYVDFYEKMDTRIILGKNLSDLNNVHLTGEYVTWFEPGMILDKNCIESFVKEFEKEDKVGILYSGVLVIEKRKQEKLINSCLGSNINKFVESGFSYGIFMYRTQIDVITGYDLIKNFVKRYCYLENINSLFHSKFLKTKLKLCKFFCNKNIVEQNKPTFKYDQNFFSTPTIWLILAKNTTDKICDEFIKSAQKRFDIIINYKDFQILKKTLSNSVHCIYFKNRDYEQINDKAINCLTKIVISDKSSVNKNIKNEEKIFNFSVTEENKFYEFFSLKKNYYIEDFETFFLFLSSRAKFIEKNCFEEKIKNIVYEFKVSVIICTYKRKDKLCDAVWSVVRQSLSKKDYEIIIVDNSPLCSDAEEIAAYFKLKYSEFEGFIKYITVLPEGLSYARNEGIRKARGEFLLFLDDDILADYHLIEEVFSTFKYHENAGVVGGQIILDVPFPRPEVIKRGFESLWSQFKVQYSTYKAITQHFELPFGANYAVRRSVALQVGGFDTSYGRIGNDFSGGEEIVFSFKAMQMGYEVGVQPRSKVLHRIDIKRFDKEHVKKTVKSIIFTMYKLQQDVYVEKRWTKKYVKNQISIIKKEISLFKKKNINNIDIFYKKCFLGAWKELFKVI